MKTTSYKGVYYALLISGLFSYYSMTEQKEIVSFDMEVIEHAIEADLKFV